MEDDEVEGTVEAVISLLAYAFEPIRRGNRAVIALPVEEVVEPVVWGEERVGNTTWCRCGGCPPMPTVSESICCQEAGLEHVLRGHSCITVERTFSILCREVDVLEVTMLSLKDVRAESLERPVNSNLFRLTAYRQFTLWARGHLGKKNRILIPACVVSAIRAVFPSPEYRGFDELCYGAVRMQICSDIWQQSGFSTPLCWARVIRVSVFSSCNAARMDVELHLLITPATMFFLKV